MNIIGLGNGGIRIANIFSSYEQYDVYRISTNLKEDIRNKNIKYCNSPEQYEEECPDLSNFLSPIKDEVLFILVGSADISAASLRILEQTKNCKISILYIRPDLNLLSSKKLMHEKVIFNVLQEYTRSGLFEKLYLVDNVMLEQIIGEIPITLYHDKLNELIVSTLHMLNVYKHNEPLMLTDPELSAISRIATFGIVDTKTGKENLFFKLENITNKFYTYSMNKDLINKDGKLLVKVKSQVKEKLTDGTKGGFAIYQNEYPENYVYVECYTHFVQNSLPA